MRIRKPELMNMIVQLLALLIINRFAAPMETRIKMNVFYEALAVRKTNLILKSPIKENALMNPNVQDHA